MTARHKVIVNADSLKKLKPVLDSWIDTVLKYSEATEDACWWYNERANISILAAAAWRTKRWVALEEFSTEKRKGDGKSGHGRCDLYMEDGKVSYAIEAKRVWQFIDRPDNRYTIGKLEDAWKDAGALQKDEADIRIAATFIVPSIDKSQTVSNGVIDDKQVDALMKDWLKHLQEKLQSQNYSIDAFAYIYNPSERHINDQGRIFPGVALLLQHRQRANNASGK